MAQLTDNHANDAFSDFYGSGTRCIFKTGPASPKRTGDQAQGTYRPPNNDHPIHPVWLSVGRDIAAKLDSLQVDWNAINPLAYANSGEAGLICPFVIAVGVKPGSTLYDAAVVAANAVHEILDNAGFPEIQVVIIESVLHRS